MTLENHPNFVFFWRYQVSSYIVIDNSANELNFAEKQQGHCSVLHATTWVRPDIIVFFWDMNLNDLFLVLIPFWKDSTKVTNSFEKISNEIPMLFEVIFHVLSFIQEDKSETTIFTAKARRLSCISYYTLVMVRKFFKFLFAQRKLESQALSIFFRQISVLYPGPSVWNRAIFCRRIAWILQCINCCCLVAISEFFCFLQKKVWKWIYFKSFYQFLILC